MWSHTVRPRVFAVYKSATPSYQIHHASTSATGGFRAGQLVQRRITVGSAVRQSIVQYQTVSLLITHHTQRYFATSIPTVITAPLHTPTTMSSQSIPTSNTPHTLFDNVKSLIIDLVTESAALAYNGTQVKLIPKLLQKPTSTTLGDLTLPLFTIAKSLDKTAKVDVIAQTLYNNGMSKLLQDDKYKSVIAKAEVKGAYVNFFLQMSYLCRLVPAITSGQYLAKQTHDKQTRVMIEYSQPNTHKAFHVGHMRNAALGDCLVRVYEQTGYHVTAVTYYGDEGAHVAKCLWWLQQYMRQNPNFNLDTDVEPDQRGEWLGGMYTAAVQKLDLSSYTSMPYIGVVSAKVASIDKHPAAEAPANWHVVTLQLSAEDTGKTVQVVCGGKAYTVGDIVAYMPVGEKLDKTVIAAKDMKGVQSVGVMLSRRELGMSSENASETDADDTNILVKSVDAAKLDGSPAKGKKADKDKKGVKPDKNAKQAAIELNDVIFTLPRDSPVGVELTELGRLSDTDCPADVKVLDLIKQRQLESKQLLRLMETDDHDTVALWKKTGNWSLDEFRKIHNWLNCRFDIEFFESMVGAESVALVKQLYADGKLTESNGAIGADLNKHKLGFCLLLKSNGSGLYATKDLSLAKRKFEQYKINQSIYVVDTAQALHFKQVFKILEVVMNYPQAANCYHLSYGQVVLPSGRMKSRSGQVILFSQLKRELGQQIYTDFLAQHDGNAKALADGEKQKEAEIWSADEIAAANHAISVGTIKYGMLNHDTIKDITFVLSEWTARSGNTGPYMMYAYARIASIVRAVEAKFTDAERSAKPDYALLTHAAERDVVLELHKFWGVVEQCTADKNPSSLCTYAFDLAKSFTSFYEACSVANAETVELKVTRLEFIKAIALTIQKVLHLLGIETLERM